MISAQLLHTVLMNKYFISTALRIDTKTKYYETFVYHYRHYQKTELIDTYNSGITAASALLGHFEIIKKYAITK